MFYIGLGLIARSPFAILLTLAILAPAFMYRVKVEEEALAKHVRGYAAYMRRTKMFVPRLV
jgi:protein-S-isoprenylcysteine O-methyltransferase Ste14